MKYSAQRGVILQNMQTRSDHPTAKQVFTDVRKSIPAISLATVYRNLGLLADSGYLRRIPILEESDRFDARMDHHFHARCEVCGHVFDVEPPELHGAKISEQLMSSIGFFVIELDIIVTGTCSSCLSSHTS